VLGNGSNQYSLIPELNEEIRTFRLEDPEGKSIVKLDAADEYTGILTKDGTMYVWGKNDRGQMGVGSGMGIDMVESENTPVSIQVADKAGNMRDVDIKDFHTGQNTMIIRDVEDRVYKVGLKIDYTPKEIDFLEEFPREDVKQITCGRRHYVVLSNNN
jgi:alpha-tubulin suppressor-like RCC1 family protein